MNTRSKTREMIQNGEICSICYDIIDEQCYGASCQANEKICYNCIGYKCHDCKKKIQLERKIYVLDGMPTLRPICYDCCLLDK